MVLAHGDCDGVIAGALYVKHFLRDRYPSDVILGFTQPWRASKEIRELCREGECGELALIDIAVDREVFSMIVDVAMKGVAVSIIDHHTTTKPWVDKIRELGARIAWDRASSTPSLMASKLRLSLNSYEEKLVKVADACEGGEASDEEVRDIADSIKLAISRDPGDLDFLRTLFSAVLMNKDLRTVEAFEKKAFVGKMLLEKLIEKATAKGEVLGSALIASVHPPESRLFAGLFGIASTEISRRARKDVVLVRDEGSKVVVTVRSSRGNALNYCKALVDSLGGKYGGHREAASATIPGRSFDEVIRRARELLWALEGGKGSS